MQYSRFVFGDRTINLDFTKNDWHFGEPKIIELKSIHFSCPKFVLILLHGEEHQCETGKHSPNILKVDLEIINKLWGHKLSGPFIN